MREIKPQIILSVDEYNELLNGKLAESQTIHLLLTFIINLSRIDLMTLNMLHNKMTKSGYCVRYIDNNGNVTNFGEGNKIFLLKQSDYEA